MKVSAKETRRSSLPDLGLQIASFVLLLAIVPANQATSAEQTPPLRYQFVAGKEFAYSVTIKVDLPANMMVETLEGTPVFKVLSNENGRAQLAFTGRLNYDVRDNAGKVVPNGNMIHAGAPALTGVAGPAPLREPHELTVNEHGDVIAMRGTSVLPYFVGQLSLLPLHAFPDKAERTWTVELNPNDGSRVGGKGQEGAGAPEGVIVQKSIYTLTKSSDAEATMSRKFQYKSNETLPNGQPKLLVEGDGKVTFDRRRGLIASVGMKLKAVVVEGSETTRLDIAIDMKLLEEDYLQRLAETKEARKRLTAEQLKQLTADLKSNDEARLSAAIDRLGEITPSDEQKSAIAAALLVAVRNPKLVNASRLADLLSDWTSAKDVPALIKLLSSQVTTVRWGTIHALGKLQDERAIEPLFGRFKERMDVTSAGAALEKFGPDAEKGALKLLTSKEPRVRAAAYGILQHCTSPESEAALRKALDTETDEHALRSGKFSLEWRVGKAEGEAHKAANDRAFAEAGRRGSGKLPANSPNPAAKPGVPLELKPSGKLAVGDKVYVGWLGDVQAGEIVEVTKLGWYQARIKISDGVEETRLFQPDNVLRAPADATVGAKPGSAPGRGNTAKFAPGDKVLVDWAGIQIGEVVELANKGRYAVRMPPSPGGNSQTVPFDADKIYPAPAGFK